MEHEYDSRRNCASQVKREQFFSVSYSAVPFPTVNCQLSTVNWIHTFSAKEKDAETGLSYFGSRYYSSDLSIWLSVDPMSDKYPSLSPYTYCANNPINIEDQDGEDIIGALIGSLVGATTEIISQTIANGMDNLSKGKGFFEGWSKQIDWFDVGVSAAVGALDGLLPGSGKLAGELVGDVTKASIDWKKENINKNGKEWEVIGISKDPTKFALDLVTNLASTGFSHISGLSNLEFERQYVNPGFMIFESFLKGSLGGTFNAVNKIIQRDIDERNKLKQKQHNVLGYDFIIGPLILEKIEK